MNQKDQGKLIDEDELRAALRPLRVDPDAFEQEVRRRMEALEAETTIRLRSADVGGDGSRDAKFENSGWSGVAASVIPLNVLGKGTSGTGTITASIGQTSLSQLSLGQKIVALAAVPAITILLMISATVWACVRIRKNTIRTTVGQCQSGTINDRAEWLVEAIQFADCGVCHAVGCADVRRIRGPGLCHPADFRNHDGLADHATRSTPND
ncbi:MAG: hypothetical protein ABGZ53_32935 [Fuerstiella sp.]